MTNLGFGTADVGGAFVNELAKELGKAPATLVAYLKKHLPATLTKRKNSNNRLANFATADGVSGLRAHYQPTYSPAPESSELQRLREENARLQARVEELEQALEVRVNKRPSRAKEIALEMSNTIGEISKTINSMSTTIDVVTEEETNGNRFRTSHQSQRPSNRQAKVGQENTDSSEQTTDASKSNVVRFPKR